MESQSQSHLQRGNLIKQFNILVLFGLLLLVVSVDVIESQFLVNTLPGFVGDIPFTLETGYIGIGESDDVQWFYYFVESEGNSKEDPLMLWLTSGPGCSGLKTLVSEAGPFIFNQANSTYEKPVLEINPDRWTKTANMLYVDQPTGTGFSYGRTSEAYITNDTLSTIQVYQFINKWLLDHPKFLNNPFYLGGDSYSGILVPIIVQEIYKGNEAGEEPQINIKGYMLGNPLTNIQDDYNSGIPFAHRVALLSDRIFMSTHKNCHGEYMYPDPNNSLCMRDLQVVNMCLGRINKEYILDPFCDDTSNTLRRALKSRHKTSKENWLLDGVKRQQCHGDSSLITVWANRKDVHEALHLNEEYDDIKWVACNESLTYEYKKEAISYTNIVPSTVAYHRNLTYKNSRVLIYSGDHDMLVPYLGTEKWIKSLNLLLVDKWRPWMIDNQVAGYTMKYSIHNYSLTFATVKGGGHTSAWYRPKECSSMVMRWLSNTDL